MEKVIIVNENDELVRICERDQWQPGEIHRVAAIWISNSKGEVLLAQRALTKRYAPGKWGPAAAGTVNEGESYESNIIKEVQEEIGLSISSEQLQLGPKEIVGKMENRRMRQWFLLLTDMPIDSLILQEEEVMGARWIAIPDLERDLQENPDIFIGAIDIFPTLISWSKSVL